MNPASIEADFVSRSLAHNSFRSRFLISGRLVTNLWNHKAADLGGYKFCYEGNGFGNYMSETCWRSCRRKQKETRYQDGRWQRYLKSDKRGWIDCHPWQVTQPLERVGPAIHPIGERITSEKTDVCLVYQDSLAREPNQIARLMYDNLNLQIANGFSEQLVEYIRKDAAQYGKGDVIEIPDRNTQVILGNSLK